MTANEMPSAQILEKDGEPAWAILPIAEYRRLVEAAEELDDIALFDRAMANPTPDFVPAEMVDRLLAGENPVRIWRQHRGMTQAALASAARIAKPYLSQLESGKRAASQVVLRRLARALRVDIDDLVPAEPMRKRQKRAARP